MNYSQLDIHTIRPLALRLLGNAVVNTVGHESKEIGVRLYTTSDDSCNTLDMENISS